jgi:hypothetical protein
LGVEQPHATFHRSNLNPVSIKPVPGHSPRSLSEMQSKKSRDNNDYDHHADDVKNIHFFAPVEATPTLVQWYWCALVPTR